MDDRFLTGLDEVDEQHREIHDVANQIIEAVRSGDRWHLVHYMLIRFAELLKFHCAVEESVMRILAFPDLDAHKAQHREMLDEVEKFKNDSLHAQGLDDSAFDEHKLSFMEHILEHDLKFIDHVRLNLPSLRN